MVGGASVHISKQSLFRLKITVGCRLRAYPSIHLSLDEDTLRITAGCPPCTYPSTRNKNLHTCWTPWSTQETRGLWTRPPVLTPVPSQAIHSRACLNLHHCDIQHCAEITLCQHLLRPSTKKKNRNLLVTVWEPGQDTQNKDNGHVRQQRDTTHGTKDTCDNREPNVI